MVIICSLGNKPAAHLKISLSIAKYTTGTEVPDSPVCCDVVPEDLFCEEVGSKKPVNIYYAFMKIRKALFIRF